MSGAAPNPTPSTVANLRVTTSRTTLIGVLFMACAMLFLPAGDAVGKYLLQVTAYSPEFVTWSRFVIGVSIALPVALVAGWFRGLGPGFWLQQAVRGALVSGAIVFILNALKTIPLADAYGGFFAGPVVATILAMLLLKEKVTGREWVAVALGFAGVMLVVQPSFTMQTGLLWALAAGCCYGSFLVATRWAAGNGQPMAQLTGQLIFACLFLTPLGVGDVIEHGIQQPQWLVVQAALSAAANLLSILALTRAPAAWLAPVVYVQIISAASLSWLIFGDTLTTVGVAGLALIVAAGLTRIPRRSQVDT